MTTSQRHRTWAFVALALSAGLLAGCFDFPPLSSQWGKDLALLVDGGAEVDLEPPPADLTEHPDLTEYDASTEDLAHDDLAMEPDLAVEPDLAEVDQAEVDQAESKPDLAHDDLAMEPDLAVRDMAVVDLAPRPDLAMPDLAMPDLRPPGDMAMPVVHSNGVGETWQDNVPLGTHNAAQALKACEAHYGIGVCENNGQCGDFVPTYAYVGFNQQFVWHFRKSPAGPNENLPGQVTGNCCACQVVGNWN